MKHILFLAFAILGSANAVEDAQPEHDYIYFPDGDGNPHLVDLSEEGTDLTGFDSGDEILTRNLDTITFNLFTIDNPTTAQVLVLNSIRSVRQSNWRSSRPTRFFAHGWLSSQDTQASIITRDAYIAAGDYNVIIIDWSTIAKASYTSAAPSTRGVAAQVALMIDFLNQNAGLDLRTTTVVGHSLGAHVAGLSARFTTGQVRAVVGLDPALPLFATAAPGRRIDSTDAEHVQVMHTNGGLLGMSRAVGDTDFYPNGGSRQPGCGLDPTGICAHARAYYYFAESIANPTGFRAIGRTEVFMGGRKLDESVSGSFNLKTASSSPFALG